MMEQNTNTFKPISEALDQELRKPKYDKEGLTLFRVGEHIEVRNYIFVVSKLDDLSKPNRLVLVPVGPVTQPTQVAALNELAVLSGSLNEK